ncbi:hypothetical protein ACIU1J_01135 [Azospirillum doebereinerae]|uniref:hypothetical protein n=1 Tax=Azospirillum doebereinerae TaxID=92933 RepID=UPI00384AEFEA
MAWTPMPWLTVLLVSLGYLSALFAIAHWADRRAAAGHSVIASPTVYALSLGVYCTTWTFYGSVGRAASQGIGFLPIYLGPTLTMLLAPLLMRKILRIAKTQRITSIADFIASRYGRSPLLGGLVALTAVAGVTPYIALQLKAVAVSFDALTGSFSGDDSPFLDTGFAVAAAMALFAMVFGTRQIDAAEHHPGMVAAVAFESLVKLVAFLAVGGFVVWGLHGGLEGLFADTAARPDIQALFAAEPALGDGAWATSMLLAAAAILCLPRQFQVMVIENVEERHLNRALWLFPLYMLLINLFVLPVAVSGLLRFGGDTDPDLFVIALPLSSGMDALALLAFLGGLSAAAGMIVVESVALSTMVCNDLVMPALLRLRPPALERSADLSRLLLAIRRAAIAVILLLGYVYFRVAGSAYALVSIGLISFAAVAQFAPALIGGLCWQGATRRGALAGLVGGALVWTHTLLLPSFARSGWLPASFIESGPWGIASLRPYALFGLEGVRPADPRAVLERAGQHRPLHRPVADRPPRFGAAGPGRRLRRGVRTVGTCGAAGRLAGGWPASATSPAWSRASWGRSGPRRPSPGPTPPHPPDRSGCGLPSDCWPERSAARRPAWRWLRRCRAARWARRSCCACWTRPATSSPTAASWRRRPPRWNGPPTRCAPPTNG